MHEKQKSMTLTGQTMHPKRPHVAHVENKTVPPLSGISQHDSLTESSRKRKSTAMDQRNTISVDCIPGKSNMKRDCGSHFGVNAQENSSGLSLNWTHQSESIISMYEPREDLSSLPNLAKFGLRNCVAKDNLPVETCSFPAESFRHSEVLEQSFAKPEIDGRTCSQEGCKIRVSCNLKQSGTAADVTDHSASGSVSFNASACTEQIEADRLLQNELQCGSAPLNFNLDHKFFEKDQCHEVLNINNMKRIEGADVKNLGDSLKEKALLEKRDSLANIVNDHDQRIVQSHGLKLLENGQSHSAKVASAVAEKLWDGSIQLNYSVTVSAIAFFKSGERIPDINWSEFIEVKGKVRLDDFEKYIQELPRSRTRGLMVISLCWKDGSSETGLMGMKKVAKKYKDGKKVGLARLSAGVDLYICPRCDTIITILAKYGFFKGMMAIEDNQDSLIGCVVWRKAHSSNSVTKKSEREALSSEPLNSGCSSSQLVSPKQLCITQPTLESSQLASAMGCGPVESVVNNGIESKRIGCGKVEVEVGFSSSMSVPLLAPTALSMPTSTSGRPQISQFSNLVTVEGKIIQLSFSSRLEHQKPVLPLPSVVARPPVSGSRDDDLPEFDFRRAHGISQTLTTSALGAVTLDKRLPTEGLEKIQKNLTLPQLQIDSNLELPPLRRAKECVSKIPVLSKLESRATITPAFATGASLPNNLFDDNDMPEWCPPVLDLHRPSPAEATKLPTSFPSIIQNYTSEIFHPVHLLPLLPSRSPASMPLPSSQAFPLDSVCPSNYQEPGQLRPANGNILRGLNPWARVKSCPPLEPLPHPYNIKFPIHHTGWRGQKL